MCITTIWLVSWYHGAIGSYTSTRYTIEDTFWSSGTPNCLAYSDHSRVTSDQGNTVISMPSTMMICLICDPPKPTTFLPQVVQQAKNHGCAVSVCSLCAL